MGFVVRLGYNEGEQHQSVRIKEEDLNEVCLFLILMYKFISKVSF